MARHFTHLVRPACPFPLLEDWLRWWLNPLQPVRQGSQELPGRCWRTGKLLCPRINLSEGIKTQPQCSRQRVFTLQAPHFLFRKHTTITPFCIPTRLPFICVCYYMAYTDMFVCFHWCAHIHWERKNRSVYCKLVKRKKGLPLVFSPLARLPFRE